MSRRQLFFTITLFAAWTFAARFLPHTANMTPMGALALFAGVYLSRRWAFVVPLGVLLVSDAWMGGYELPVMLSVYGSFAMITGVGAFLRQRSFGTRLVLGPLASSTFFFLITNFAVWAATPFYAKTGAGLLTSYMMGIPFWRNMLVGDILYMVLFFGIAEILLYAHTYGLRPSPTR